MQLFARIIKAAVGTVPLLASWHVLAQTVTAPIQVYDTQILPSLDIPASQAPTQVHILEGEKIRKGASLPESFAANNANVNLSDFQGSPDLQEFNFRGYVLSSNLGEPQGLSAYLDGMRLNEPFADTVSWDLIPMGALSSANLISGAQPAFGLNSLGGTLSLHSNSGAQSPGTQLQTGGGFNLWNIEAARGTVYGKTQTYFYGLLDHNGGWRDFSPADKRQAFIRVDHNWDTTDGKITFMYGNNDFFGNGLTPRSMLNQRWKSIYTAPDVTHNNLTAVNATLSHSLDDNTLLNMALYHQQYHRQVYSGDVNNDYANAGDPEAEQNAFTLDQKVTGLTLQFNCAFDNHTLSIGTNINLAQSNFSQGKSEGTWDDRRYLLVNSADGSEQTNVLRVNGKNFSFYAVERWRFLPTATAHFSAQLQYTRLDLIDRFHSTPPTLDGNHSYDGFNPAVGLVHELSPALSIYGQFGQTGRAPSPIELGCADKDNPCTLPNALTSDPSLKQVTAYTIETGIRGGTSETGRWSAGVYASRLNNDILFVSTGQTSGYFANFGHTQRTGLELQGDLPINSHFSFTAGYALTHATFESEAVISSPFNTSAGENGLHADEIQIKKGDVLPNVPLHRLVTGITAKTGRVETSLQWITQSWNYVRGNENNEESGMAGKNPGFGLLNFSTLWRAHPKVAIEFAVNNLLNRHYYNGGQLGRNSFNISGGFEADPNQWRNETFYSPGMPVTAILRAKLNF